MDRLLFQSGPPDQRSAIRRERMVSGVTNQIRLSLICCNDVVSALLQAEESGPVGFAELSSCLNDRVENRLKLRRCAIDDVQNIRRGGLVIQSFLELSRAFLHLLKETNIRDRDDRLISEGLQNSDLTF